MNIHEIVYIMFLLHTPINLTCIKALGTVYPKKYAHGFCFAVLCCGYTLTDFPISSRLTSLALWQSNDCPSASKATLMNMDKYFMWIHYERLHYHNKAKHNKTVCIFLGIYCMWRHMVPLQSMWCLNWLTFRIFIIQVVNWFTRINSNLCIHTVCEAKCKHVSIAETCCFY